MNPGRSSSSPKLKAPHGRHRGLEVGGRVFYIESHLVEQTPPLIRSEIYYGGRVLRTLDHVLSEAEIQEGVEAAVVRAQEKVERFFWTRLASRLVRIEDEKGTPLDAVTNERHNLMAEGASLVSGAAERGLAAGTLNDWVDRSLSLHRSEPWLRTEAAVALRILHAKIKLLPVADRLPGDVIEEVRRTLAVVSEAQQRTRRPAEADNG